MNNSISIRLLKNFYIKQKPLLRFYCHKNTSIVEFKAAKKEQWEKKMMFYMKTYEDMFGITKLTEMHEKVVEVQTKLQTVQDKRRKVLEDFFHVQKKLQEKRDILHSTPFEDAKYISVMTQVHELLKDQKRLQDVISLYDQTEREQQTALALAINNSQDYERTYREKNKYLSLITGIVGAILGLAGSSINNWRHRKDIKVFASGISDQVIDLKKSVEKLKLAFLTNEIVSNAPSGEETQTENLLTTIKYQHDVLDDRIKSLQSLLNNVPVSDRIHSKETFSDVSMEDILKEFESNIETKLDRHSYVNLSLIGSWALFSALFILYVTKNS